MPDEGNDNPSPGSTPPTTPGPGPRKKILTPSAETKPDKDKNKGKKQRPEPTTFGGKLWHNWVKPVGSVIVIVIVVRSMLIDWNDVPSGSMEPEIHVGDRIAVNRLAYGLQFPLTGPEIGIPFIGPQFDNPLDGIPQIAWGSGPARGDIVTFWNPVTKVRMVKRIVAIPGDTVSMSGGVMTINGTAATYTDLDPAAEGLPVQTKFKDSRNQDIFRDLTYKEETLLGETRIVQIITKRWIEDGQVIETPDGRRYTIDGGMVTDNFEPVIDLPRFMQTNNILTYNALAEIKDAALYIDGKQVDYNTFAAKMLETYESDGTSAILNKIGLSLDGHEMRINDEPVPFAFFEDHFRKSIGALPQSERAQLEPFLSTLRVLHHATLNNFGPVTLEDDEYLMVGDNRNNSHDGRMFGPVMRSEITGEAFAIAFSFKDNKMFTLPPKPAWKRWFKDLD